MTGINSGKLGWVPLIAIPMWLSATAAEAQQRTSAADENPICRYGAGDLPKATLAAGSPLGKKIPIDHFVIVVQENRSFDHYLQGLPQHGQFEADVAPASVTNPSTEGGIAVARHRLSSYCVPDIPHDINSVATQHSGGALSGFARSAKEYGENAMGYYEEQDLPFYYRLFSTFSMADRYFSGLLGPTWPNRMVMLSGSAFGHVDNTPPPPRGEEHSLFHQLEAIGASWKVYRDKKTFEEEIFPRLSKEAGKHFDSMDAFAQEAKAGKLPNLAWVQSSYGDPEATDEHPPANVQLGQLWVWKITEAILRSPAWKRTALIITYDEHGGFYDHVPPPKACPPDGIKGPRGQDGKPFRFDRLGFRVPFVIVSPYSKKNHVSHQTYSHASVLRLVQARFNLPALSARDANALPPFDMFDFAHPPFVTAPEFEAPPVNAKAAAACRAQYKQLHKPHH